MSFHLCINTIHSKFSAMSHSYDDSSEDDYEQYEEECEWYEEYFPSCNTSYNFIRDEGYSYEFVYYEVVCAKPPLYISMDEL